MINVASKKVVAVPIFAAILLAFLFALMGVWIRMMQSSFGTWQQVYLRILLAGLLATVVFRKSFTWTFMRQLNVRDWVIYIIRAIFAYVVAVGFFTIAVEHAQLGTVSFIASLPIIAPLAWVFFRERVKLGTLPYIALSIVGLVLLTGLSFNNFSLGWGEIAAIVSLLGFDVGVLMSRYHRKSFSIYQNTTLLLLVGWVPLFAISMASHESLFSPHVTVSGWIGLACSAVSNVVILYLIHYVFAHLKAYVAGNLLLLEGVFALLIGFIVYGEIPTVVALVGAGIILACGFMISVIDSRAVRPESAGANIG